VSVSRKRLSRTLVKFYILLVLSCVYWAGLYQEEIQKMINAGVDLMMKTAMRLLGKQGRGPGTLALEDVVADDEEDEQPEDPQPDRDPGEK
jgi:hypothetical protein